MMKKMPALLVLLILVVSLSSCATGRKSKNLEMQGLRNQISVLQAQLQAKDEEINTLRDSLSSATSQVAVQPSEPIKKKKVIGEVKSRPNIRQIQTALKNAGYEPGAIDGKMGKQTKEAIRAFQRANGLNPDGKTGKNTWKLLSKYLYQKVK